MATRSSSPNPSRPSSHNARTPEGSHGLRKSREIPQRNSLSRSGSPSPRASLEQKENIKSRSPAVSSSSKGGKSFMAPTISAASRAVLASPRKKILQERNEFDSLVKEAGNRVEIEVNGAKLDTGFVSGGAPACGGMKKGVQNVDVGSKTEVGFSCWEAVSGGELKKGGSGFKNYQNLAVSSGSPLSIIAPLDADPSLPPYDPKTNYLSPRPQFLHYRPNPRIEQYRCKEGELLDAGDGRRLDDSFSSESSEDEVTGLTIEKDSEEEISTSEAEGGESLTEPEVKSITPVAESRPEPDNLAAETKSLVSEHKVKSITPVAEPKPEPDNLAAETEVEESETPATEPELKSKPLRRKPFRKSKLAAFLLVLVMVFLSTPLSDTPAISSSMSKDQTPLEFYSPSFAVFESLHLGDYWAVANKNLHGLAGRIRDWSTDSIAFFTSMTSPLKDDLGLYLSANMTSSPVDRPVSLDFSYNHVIDADDATEDDREEVLPSSVHELEEFRSEDIDSESYAEKLEVEMLDDGSEVVQGITNEAEDIEMVVNEDVTEVVQGITSEAEFIEMMVTEDVTEVDVTDQRIEIEAPEDVINEDNVGHKTLEDIIPDDGISTLEQEGGDFSYETPQLEEVEDKLSPLNLVFKPETVGHEEDLNDANTVDQTCSTSSVEDQLEVNEYEDSHGSSQLKSMKYAAMFGVPSALALPVITATVIFLTMMRKQPSAVVRKSRRVKNAGLVIGSNKNDGHAQRSPTQIHQWNEEMSGDSSGSEVSSSRNDSSSSGQHQMKRDKEQTLSNERRARRDSAASISTSYGSFTTYERLSARKAGREEEVVTPVRRSSRIRNLTSP